VRTKINKKKNRQFILLCLGLDKFVQGPLLAFYFLFTIVMKVLVSCTENSNFFIKVLDELELFIDKKVIFDSVGPPPPVSKICDPYNSMSSIRAIESRKISLHNHPFGYECE
jgi:hypothetical protein